MAVLNPYDRAVEMFEKLGYKEGFEGYCCDTGIIPKLYEEHFGDILRTWNLQPKSFKAGAYFGFRKGWEKGYKDAIVNELWLLDTQWQLRQPLPRRQAVQAAASWDIPFEQGPPILPMAIPSHLKNR